MLVQPGTTLQLQGPISWELLAGSQVTNDGRIEFRDGALLAEAPGAPIVGSGTEHAWITESSPVNGSQPGGLGLELTSAGPIGPLELVRGHLPFTLGNGDESIARWFKFEEGTPAGLSQLVLHFDSTELNGLFPADLRLHDSEDPSSFWVPMPSSLGADQVSLIATDHSPRPYITAFHFNSTTGIDEIGEAGYLVFPTITSDLVTITSRNDLPIERIEIFDAAGKELPVQMIGTIRDSPIKLDLSGRPIGNLLLRINGRHVFKLVRT